MKKAESYFIPRLTLFGFTFVLISLFVNAKEQNKHIKWKQYAALQTGMIWPKGQVLPQLALPADTLDGIDINNKGDMNSTGDRRVAPSSSEKTLFVVFQGLVNKNKPRIFIHDRELEGKNRWPDNLKLNISEYPGARKWELLKKYQHEISGVILYNTEKSGHYRNLAVTVSGIKNALPVTPFDYNELKANGIQLPVLEDLTKLSYSTPVEIYRYLYNNYWKYCTKKLLMSLSTNVEGKIRDIGVASKSAFLWLDPRKEEEKSMLNQFFGDMKAGESIILGWWPEERSGIGLGTSFGISTIPADFYENASVYSGMSHIIRLPEVPKKPKLENKIYISIFLSDGDNVQYCQHTLPKLWDDKNRGKIPINWTVSPGLVDIGPGLLNYFYSTASPNDFFASGPSGLGYALIYDALNKKWYMTNPSHIDAYTKFTQKYLEKGGFRVITIWDEINEQQMEAYATNCRYLYGATLEDWQRAKPLQTIVKQNKLSFIPNIPCYANKIDAIYKKWEQQIKAFDGSKPLFLTAQGVSWKMGPDDIAELKMKLEKLSPGNIVICRGDHFFSLYNEANHLDFNLTLSAEMKITSSSTSTQTAYAADGTPSGKYKWISSGTGEKWIQFDFNQPYLIDRYVIDHAGTDGLDPSLNTRSFRLEVSADGITWKTVNRHKNNKDNITDIDIDPVKARYIRLNILNAGRDGIARIGDIEIHGKRIF